MTLWVSRDGQDVTIHGTSNLRADVRDSRVQEWAVTEHAGHMKHFWSQLGREIEAADAEATPVHPDVVDAGPGPSRI